MAMKKKFLGLALAGAMTLSASSVYATGTTEGTQTINAEQNAEITVTGTVQNKEGKDPERIEVVLPSKLSFTVDKDNRFLAPTNGIEIDNSKSNVAIDVSVANFTGSTSLSDGLGKGIEVVPEDTFGNGASHYRNEIKLELSKIGSTTEKVDLAKVSSNTAEKNKLGTIGVGSKGTVFLTGACGTKEVAEDNKETQQNVDKDGAQAEFKLVFGISKYTN